MTTEIRDYGDKEVAVYTNQQSVLTQLRSWKELIRIVWYEQALNAERTWPIVAADLFFPKFKATQLYNALGFVKPKKQVKQSEAFKAARSRMQFRKRPEMASAR